MPTSAGVPIRPIGVQPLACHDRTVRTTIRAMTAKGVDALEGHLLPGPHPLDHPGQAARGVPRDPDDAAGRGGAGSHQSVRRRVRMAGPLPQQLVSTNSGSSLWSKRFGMTVLFGGKSEWQTWMPRALAAIELSVIVLSTGGKSVRTPTVS